MLAAGILFARGGGGRTATGLGISVTIFRFTPSILGADSASVIFDTSREGA